MGSQIKLGPSHSILLGAIYNPSTINNMASANNGTAQLNYYGGSLGLRFTGQSVTATLGGYYYWSYGTIVESIPGSSASGVFGNIQTRLFGALFSVSSNM
jgi:hypothetical protein